MMEGYSRVGELLSPNPEYARALHAIDVVFGGIPGSCFRAELLEASERYVRMRLLPTNAGASDIRICFVLMQAASTQQNAIVIDAGRGTSVDVFDLYGEEWGGAPIASFEWILRSIVSGGMTEKLKLVSDRNVSCVTEFVGDNRTLKLTRISAGNLVRTLMRKHSVARWHYAPYNVRIDQRMSQT